MTGQKTFRLGISMAGAVSAGAYTAGVMDYLLEALENWYEAKERGLPGVPEHDVVIEVIGGSSAGGMTAVITCGAVQKLFPHVSNKNLQNVDNTKNPLYDSWVNLTQETEGDMMNQMLNPSDILSSGNNPKKEVRSLLNSGFIERIANRTLDSIIPAPNIKRPYIADDLELFTTITNLKGFNYEIQFNTALGFRDDYMTMHKDLINFQVNPTNSYKNDGKIPVHFNAPDGLNKDMLIDAAIATGAFPAGLEPREIKRNRKYINDNQLLQAKHRVGDVIKQPEDYIALCVDGGVINNEPYDVTGRILSNRRFAEIELENGKKAAEEYIAPITPDKFDTTVLLIDPFPSYDAKPPAEYVELPALRYALPELFGAMRKQLMFKAEVLAQANDPADCTRFMISPIRKTGDPNKKNYLACGSMSGFGGFFCKEFRIHDYMLGRRNCQRFIQKYFCVPVAAHNPIIDFGYKNSLQGPIFFYTDDSQSYLPIIPDIRISEEKNSIIPPLPEDKVPYPSIKLSYILNLEEKVQQRCKVILDNILNSKNPGARSSRNNEVVKRIRKKGWINENILGPVKSYIFLSLGKYFVKRRAAEELINFVIADMSDNKLLEDDLF